MAISKKEVKHIACLARLSVNDKEINLFQKDLGEILSYVDRLKTVKTEKGKNLAAKKIFNIFRKDKINAVSPDYKRENFLKKAPDKKDNFFKVPSILK
jgi:aspartyl-tRNA(Asn)/glutamyl-tRNA(Gln) amidotransferase subunit C